MAKSPGARGVSRRQFLTDTAMTSAALAVPSFLARVSLSAAQVPPSRRINVVQIGCGRMGMEDLRGTIRHDLCRMVAVCDLDAKRLEKARAEVEQYYKGKGESSVTVDAYHDYHEVLARKDVDAVLVTPPDHWHAMIAIEAALAGKDLHVQKPLTYDIAESIALRTAVRATGRILQTGSQQRSSRPWNTFRMASEAVRNGRIGQVKVVRIGIGQDQPRGLRPEAQPVPSSLAFEEWLGPAPQQAYMEDRVHPQAGYGRPGWITTEDFGLGMITNWGAHHVDIMQWALGQELGGPTAVEGRATFMTGDVWTVHHTYHVEMSYPGGVQVILDDAYPNGIRFEGTEGWVFCARGAAQVTSSDPGAGQAARGPKPLEASNPTILTAPYGPDAKRWPASDDHYLDWLQAIAARKDPIAPVDQAARSLQVCAVGWIAMKLQRKLTWDTEAEVFVGDAEANALRARKPRSGTYDIARVMREGGLS